ncbi:hypothetical protein Q5424_16920 [Conexibacter sp. JD483]|uniref:hypothetical protein n=1 Tax=unclassified Conexibacter TaxID=2627773 RepID=UPI002721DD3B|nr:MULTISPECIES: hypothetical protein [unclassified Conexibacter]MDO8185528.1 hypothetical protein [Conexibacter sp. CPCC 205706]MDO8197285.1 hypothetical protein [Conexibacter sp. CPCC 205762]MDR9370781.1 hypothetical protein [Conexibacter sp. JD483]
MAHRTLSTLLAAVALLLAAAAPSLAALPRALTQERPAFAVRPAQISYTGDGTGILGGRRSGGDRFGRIAWSAWTQRSAQGRGQVWLNDCRPDCAGGSFSPRPVRIVLSQPRAGKFRLLTIRYRYRGKPVLDRRSVEHHGRYWTYGIAR